MDFFFYYNLIHYQRSIIIELRHLNDKFHKIVSNTQLRYALLNLHLICTKKNANKVLSEVPFYALVLMLLTKLFPNGTFRKCSSGTHLFYYDSKFAPNILQICPNKKGCTSSTYEPNDKIETVCSPFSIYISF